MEQLQLGAVDSSSPIAELLRKAKLAAVKLRVDDFAAWVTAEADGYSGPDLVPEYRIVSSGIKYLNPYNGWCPIFNMQNLSVRLWMAAGELEVLSKAEAGFCTMSVSQAFHDDVVEQIGFLCDVKRHISTVSLHRIVEAIRGKVLDWTLKLEQAGVHGHGLTFTPEEQRTAQNVTQQIFHGPVGSVAQGHSTVSGVTQNNALGCSPQQIADAMATLLAALREAGATDPGVIGASQVIAEGEKTARAGQTVAPGRIKAALDMISTSADLAVKVPAVIEGLTRLGSLFPSG